MGITDDLSSFIFYELKPKSLHSSINSSTAVPKIIGVTGNDSTVKMAAEVGSEVVLPCETQGTPSPLVTWSRNGHPIPPVTAG